MKILVVAGVLLAVAAAASGCTKAADAGRTPATPSASTSSPAARSTRPTTEKVRDGLGTSTAGSDGFTLRYRGADGKLKTQHVEDFRR